MNIDSAYRIFRTAGLVLLGAWVLLCGFSVSVSKESRVEKELMPYKIKSRTSRFVREGWKIWLREGKNGFRNRVIERYSLACGPVSENVSYRTGVLVEPEKAFVVRGISKKKHPITVPKETFMHYVFDMEATAYDPSPESNSLEWAGITSLGWRTRYGIAAVDPRVIALRSLIYVDGYGFAWTGDVGGDIKGKRIDLCYNTTKEALQWGRRKVKVYVLGRRPLSYYKAKRRGK